MGTFIVQSRVIAGMEVGVERSDKLVVVGLILRAEGLEIEGEAAIEGIGGEEAVDLAEEVGAGVGIAEELADVVLEDAFLWVVVVDHGEDFGVFLGRGDDAGDFVLAIDAMNAGVVEDGEGRIVGAEGGEVAIRRDDVQPLREEEVDLLDVLLERGVAGGVDVGIEGGAKAFVGVQDDVGGLEICLAVCRGVEFSAGAEFWRGWVGEGTVAFGGGLEIEAPHGAYAQHANDEEDAGNGAAQRQEIKDPSQPLPALPLWVVKDLL